MKEYPFKNECYHLTSIIWDNLCPPFAKICGKSLYKSTPSSATNMVVEKVVEKVLENLSENQKQIIELVRRDKYITAFVIAKEIDISHRKVQENMAKLKEMGILKRIGPAKGGHWQIINL